MLNRFAQGTVLAASLIAAAMPAFAQDAATPETTTETAPQTRPAPSADTVVASVNGTDITFGNLIVARLALPAQYQTLPEDVLYDGILQQLIQQTLLEQSLGDDLSARLQLQLENTRRSEIAAATLEQIATAGVTDDALSAAYDAKYAEFEAGREYHAAHILVETEEEAAKLSQEARDGADFGDLAKDNSTGPTGPNGGDLGWFGAGMMVEPFEAAVVDMEEGDISDPVQTQFGWHVIKLLETRLAEAPTLDDVRDELTAEVQTQVIEDRLAALEADATITQTAASEVDTSKLTDTDLLDN
ncbi:putative parvulin-type peptidyl-prolyl cis-trans isomerase precursor [Aquimixticola soesokkakensis]|uniref:Parvulin-like PPIase n=1 Tax=Aquimixticola soesokkakensis TaxID=1519096 RepID=A0A1Y5RBM4_9RHOB|nr:peptidylprolyl isomerase [Aquimixticola soesokkakensis]SLN10906.1 putative parvulin-type peptidyl-prolyl cis-trans isomerase precursor [Aquimixticola soesokkakensis]